MGQQVWFFSQTLSPLVEIANRKVCRARKYYYVQISTSHSQWDVPTEAAPGVPTPGSTPMPPGGAGSQFARPCDSPASSETIAGDSTRGVDGGGESDRGMGV